MDIFGIAALIFLVTDPFGNIAIFIAALKNVPAKRRLWVAARELLFALALLLLFLTFGDKVLSALGLSREATAIAGGIILFVIAMRLIFFLLLPLLAHAATIETIAGSGKAGYSGDGREAAHEGAADA